MRFVRVVSFLVVLAVLSALLSLPGEVAKDYFIGRITEYVAGQLHMNSLQMESFARLAWPIIPFVAALCVLDLYHWAYSASNPNRAPIAPARGTDYRGIAKNVLAAVFATAFVAIVLYVGFNYRPPVEASLKFHDLQQVSNYELRERAFSVSAKLLALSEQYDKRKAQIISGYNKELVEWDKRKQDYLDATRKYQQTHLPSFAMPSYSSSYSSLATASSPPDSSITSLLASAMGDNKPAEVNLPTIPTLGWSASSSSLSSPVLPIDPPPTDLYGPKPEPPVVPVDDEWKLAADGVQEEASAVREEIYHRLGGYAPYLKIPETYSLDENPMVDQATRLRTLGNDLH